MIVTATGVKIGTKGKVVTNRADIAAMLEPLTKGERRRVRKELFRQPRTRSAKLHLAGLQED